jgi:hypothetical protein
LLGDVSVRKLAMAESQASAMSPHRTSSPTQVPAFPKAALNFPMTFVSHADSPEKSPVAATFAWQPSRPDSFFARAFSFAPVHRSAWAGVALTARRTNTPTAKRNWSDGIGPSFTL